MKLFQTFKKEIIAGFKFAGSALSYSVERPVRFAEIFRQMEITVYSSWLVLLVSGIFLGMALTVQLYYSFSSFNATTLLGSTLSIIFLKELGATFTAVLLSAQVGGAIVAQVGNMRVSNQIDVLEMMSVNPMHYLVGPRFWAILLMAPVLCMGFNYIAIWSSYFISVMVFNLDGAIFWHSISEWVKLSHILEGLIKSFFFGGIIAIICCYKGFTTQGGAAGVGKATNQGVVFSILGVIMVNLFLSSILKQIFE